MIAWALATALAFVAPVAAPATPVAGLEFPDREHVMALPPPLRLRLKTEVVGPARTDSERLQRLVDFMIAEHGLGMQYQGDATYTVEQAFATRKGNCLTFTLLFVALAREAGLQAYAQEIDSTLAWQQQDNTLYLANHINAGVSAGGKLFTVDVSGDSLILRHPPQRVSDLHLLADYYNNRAAELMAQGEAPVAARYMRTAIELDPDYASSWNNAGVLHLRSGELDAAQSAYTRALQLDPVNAAALFNMAGLYRQTGDHPREAAFRRRLEQVQSKDPFHQFLLAVEDEQRGDFAQAVTHYQRAIRLHGDEHRFYSRLAHAYLQLGDLHRAARALAHAVALSDDATRPEYQAKLDSLRQSANW